MRGLRSRLDRIWRMLMTGLCFVLFGLGGLTLSLVWFNLLLIFQRDRTQRRRLGTPYYFCQFSPVPRGGTRCRGTGLPFQQPWTFYAPSGAVW